MAKHEYEVAMEILEHMIFSAIFYSRRCEIALRLTIIGMLSILDYADDSMCTSIKTILETHIPLQETIASPSIPT